MFHIFVIVFSPSSSSLSPPKKTVERTVDTKGQDTEKMMSMVSLKQAEAGKRRAEALQQQGRGVAEEHDLSLIADEVEGMLDSCADESSATSSPFGSRARGSAGFFDSKRRTPSATSSDAGSVLSLSCHSTTVDTVCFEESMAKFNALGVKGVASLLTSVRDIKPKAGKGI